MTIDHKTILPVLAIAMVAFATLKAFGVPLPFLKTGIQNTCILAATLAFVGGQMK